MGHGQVQNLEHLLAPNHCRLPFGEIILQIRCWNAAEMAMLTFHPSQFQTYVASDNQMLNPMAVENPTMENHGKIVWQWKIMKNPTIIRWLSQIFTRTPPRSSGISQPGPETRSIGCTWQGPWRYGLGIAFTPKQNKECGRMKIETLKLPFLVGGFKFQPLWKIWVNWEGWHPIYYGK